MNWELPKVGLAMDPQPEATASTPFFYKEKAFNRILTLERKRTERSKRPFMLMLLLLGKTSAKENNGNLYQKIVSCMAASIRDIDVLGWYKADKVLGVIFTEIGDAVPGPAVDSILKRIKANLSVELGAEEIDNLEISLHFFPEKCDRSGISADLALYPDIAKIRSSQKAPLLLKRAIDIVGSIVALTGFAPFFLVISAIIKLTSKGPVFFRQQRVGQHGKPFTLLKFRSMYANNDPAIHKDYVKSLICSVEGGQQHDCPEGQVFKIQNDPRITPFGSLLRKTSLDELPQFLNVLRGDMSLVGPRPPIPYEIENYEIWHRRRIFDMKPGITGIWQVQGRSRTTFNEMVRLDVQYLTNWSVWLDIKLLLKTPLAVFTSKGAY